MNRAELTIRMIRLQPRDSDFVGSPTGEFDKFLHVFISPRADLNHLTMDYNNDEASEKQ